MATYSHKVKKPAAAGAAVIVPINEIYKELKVKRKENDNSLMKNSDKHSSHQSQFLTKIGRKPP